MYFSNNRHGSLTPMWAQFMWANACLLLSVVLPPPLNEYNPFLINKSQLEKLPIPL